MRWARPAVLTLLVTEGVGGLAFALLTVVIGGQITPGYVPWSFATPPLIFGATALVTAYFYWRRLSLARFAAMSVNVIVAVGGATGLLTGPHPSLWAALTLGLIGALLVVLDTRTGPRPVELPPG